MLLGKFLPPHAGHVYLVDFARHYVDELTVVVATLKSEPIPGELRYAWMRELFPSVRVVHVTDENPQQPHEHPNFWDIWRDSLLRVLPGRPDHVFASEPYGWKLAEVLGATFVPVDIDRRAVPVSGTKIRLDPLAHWNYLPRCVRPYFVKRVCVMGPESTGKTTLARRLADHFQTVMVPEYARTLLEAQGGRLREDDIPRIARGQRASEEALALTANRLLICDTDLLTTVIWSQWLYKDCVEWVRAEADRRRYNLTLLLDSDVPWVADLVRYLPGEGQQFFIRCRLELEARGRPYVVVQGDWHCRFEQAIAAIASLLRADSMGLMASRT
jgi:NadR type nicotinamide-nucleotide adenylyltransferase